jgi:hypothetical protein
VITCPKCNHVNPFGTRFCRSCGARQNPAQAEVVHAVASGQRQRAADQAWTNGVGWLTIGLFFLVCALIVRVLLVPPLPPPQVPVMDPGPVSVLTAAVAAYQQP